MSSVYAAEFKLSIVDRIKAGETAKQLSVETGIHCNTIIQWNRRYRCGKKFSKKNGRRKIVTTPVQQALQSFFEARCTPTMEDVRSKIQEELAITENSGEIKVSKSTAYMAMKGLLESRHSLSEQPHFNNSKVNAVEVLKDDSQLVYEDPSVDDTISEVSAVSSACAFSVKRTKLDALEESQAADVNEQATAASSQQDRRRRHPALASESKRSVQSRADNRTKEHDRCVHTIAASNMTSGPVLVQKPTVIVSSSIMKGKPKITNGKRQLLALLKSTKPLP